MRPTARKWRWIGLGLVFAGVAFVVIRIWVVPAIIVHEIRQRYRGNVVVGSWWLGLNSSGLEGIKLGEGSDPKAPDWLTADRVEVDVSLRSMLRGRFQPTRVTVDHPKITFRLDVKGQPITKIPLAPEPTSKAGPNPRLPEVVARDAELTLHQEGREAMTLTHVDARLSPVDDGESLDVKTDDPTWGKVAVTGHFDDSFKNGRFQIATSPGFVADAEKLRRIPFIPSEVWANIEPHGPVDAKVTITLAADAPKPVHVLTDITLKGTSAKLATLQVESTDTTGRVVVDDAMVRVDDLRGKAVDGTIAASGTLDFSRPIPEFDLALRLKGVDVTRAPAAWQLHELEATGRLSGKLGLKVALPPAGPDLTGTTGVAVIQDGSLQGIPIKSLSVRVKAEKGDIQYDTLPEGSVDPNALDGPVSEVAGTVAPIPPMIGPKAPGGMPATRGPLGQAGQVEIWEPVVAALPIIRIATHDDGLFGWSAYALTELLAYQVKQGHGKAAGLHLPKTITTKIELEDVDLKTILDKAKKFGIVLPIPVAGRFSIKATATIPIGSIRNIKGYNFKGDATLAGASVDHVDVGLLSAHVELADGVLDLSDFRGQLVDHPSGDVHNPPRPTAVPPKVGDLPPGAFRASLRAGISPPGPLTAGLEGNQLPLGELLAPVLPVPTPLAGNLTVHAQATSNVAKLDDPNAWTFQAKADSRKITYRGATVDQVAANLGVQRGKLHVTDFAASLAGQPLTARGDLDLSAPYRYDGKVNLAGWEIADVLAFVPKVPRPSPASGKLDAHGDAVGTIQPFAIQTRGGARLLKARAGALPLGAVVFQWTTDRDYVTISGLEAHPFGGKVTGEVRVPATAKGMVDASLTLKGIDSGRVAATLPPGSVEVSGPADGSIKLTMPLDASTIAGDARLSSPNLFVREGAGSGFHVQALQVSARAAKGHLDYEASADTLGGKVRFRGSAPVDADLSKIIAQSELQAAGFRLNEAWRGVGITGGLAELDGQGAIDANLRATARPFRLWSHGAFEFRDLHYGRHLNIGGVRGTVALTPTTWRLDGLTGEILGGIATGEARGESSPGQPKRINFDFHVNRALLPRMLGSIPSLARGAEGYGTLRATGQLEETLRASAEVLVPRATVHGLPISDLRLPADVELSPASGVGTVRVRHWSARVAGGAVRGIASLRLGHDQTFQTETHITGLDIEMLARAQPSGKKVASGKISGKISLNGPHPDRIDRMRGRVDLDLDDASLVEMPVFKQLDQFLGSARGGGLFEDGDIHGTIANRTLFVEALTLQGKLLQIHASGSITFDGGLDLQVLANTNDIIPQSGLALVGLVPGLGQALGRGEEAILRLANFLQNRLLKFRVTGTISNPSVKLNTGVAVTQGAAGFFSGVFKVPVGSR